MPDIKLRVEIVLIPDPAWQDLLRILNPNSELENKPENAPVTTTHLPDQGSSPYLLEEIEKFVIPKNGYIRPLSKSVLEYYENGDMLCISYLSAKIYTTWSNVLKLVGRFGDFPKTSRFGSLLNKSDSGNRRTAIIQFMKLVSSGLGPGRPLLRALGPAADSEPDPDPDRDFRPLGVAKAVYPPPNAVGDFGSGEE